MDDSDMGGDTNELSDPDTEANQTTNTSDEPMEGEGESIPPPKEPKRKFVATIHEVNEAFDSVSTLRYSQPTHLQGTFPFPPDMTQTTQLRHRQVSGPHRDPLQRRPHSRRRHLENPLSIRRNPRLCREPQSHERTPSGRNNPPTARWRIWRFRTPSPPRSVDHRR